MQLTSPSNSTLTAFVLAGGRSSRMGHDKAFLDFHGESLLTRALQLAQSVTADVAIVGPSSKFATFGRVVEDTFRNQGPLGGIHAALKNSTADLNLILAVDMPFVSPKFLAYLVDRARSVNALVTIPRNNEGWQPLCAIYQRAFAAKAEAALQAGENKIDRLFQGSDMSIITAEELKRFPGNQFRNLNTPDDLTEA
jgi:molybdenum cofactor guanylyltransferase